MLIVDYSLVNCTLIYPDNIEEKIDFGVIRNELHHRCTSSLGREQVDAMKFLTDYETITGLLSETDEMKHIMEDGSLDFPRGEMHDVREALGRIRIEGLFLDEAELFALRKTLDYAHQLEQFFASLDEQRFPILHQLPAQNTSADGIGDIVRAIDRVIDKYGRLADNASPELSRIRHELTIVQGSVGRALGQILRQAQAEGILDKDVTPTLREGRLVIPVPPAYKRKIGGIVHDESATGKTVYVEPQQVVEANNHIRELEGAERRERVRILQDLTVRLRPSVPTILQSEQMLAHVDFLRAKALLAQVLRAILPEVQPAPVIDWQQARHPVLYLKFMQQGKTVVPLSLRLQTDENRMLIISGPNAGGKSVCLKTVALLQYMLQCGLLVPLEETSRMGVFDQLMIDVGDAQSIEDDLSTYSGHLKNMKAFVRYANASTLLLIDEFGTGTEPLIGGAIAEAVLSQLVEQQAFGVITTHYTNLKHFAEQTRGVVNGAMLYDRGQMRPLFQLSIGQAGSSFAIEIAKQIGLPEHIIAHATELVGEEHIDYDKQLQDIARDKRYWENKRQNIRQREKHLEERIAYYEQEIAGLKAKKREVMDEAKQQAADLLQQSNAAIERTIREIKEAKAEKERTQKARLRVESMKQKVQPQAPAKKNATSLPTAVNGKTVMRDFSDLRALRKQKTEAPNEQKVQAVKGSNGGGYSSMVRQRVLSFERTLDLRGYRVDEALERFIAYLDDAVMVNAGEVTILHGTGTGAVKQIVRDYIDTYNKQRRKRGDEPLHYHDGDPNHGGAGLTLITIP